MDYFMPNEIKPHLCPKCNGQGIVSRPPWIAGDLDSWSTGGTSSYTCNVCNGSGLVYC